VRFCSSLLIAALISRIAVPHEAHAAERSVFQYLGQQTGTSCRFFEQREGKWKKSSPPLYPQDSVEGVLVTQSASKWVTFKHSNKRWIAEERCFSKKEARSSWNLLLGGMTWSESFSGVGSLGGVTPLRSTQFMSRLGLEWFRPSFSGVELGLEASLLLGLGSASDSSGQTYSGSGFVGGLLFSPSISWRPGSQPWGVGITTPLILRNASWPDLGSGLTLPPALGLRSALGLKVSRRGERVLGSIEAGVLGSSSNWLFSISLGLPF